MPYFAHWKSDKQYTNFGYQAINEHGADKLVVAYIFEIWNKIWGQWCKFRDIGQNTQILV